MAPALSSSTACDTRSHCYLKAETQKARTSRASAKLKRVISKFGKMTNPRRMSQKKVMRQRVHKAKMMHKKANLIRDMRESDSESEHSTASADETWDEDVLEVIETRVKASRWKCDICFEVLCDFDTMWDISDSRCKHRFCRHCLSGCIQWGGRCPYDGIAISAVEECGALSRTDFIFREKCRASTRAGRLMCPMETCIGLLHFVRETSPPQPAMRNCRTCGKGVCARRSCGLPWTPGHRCADIIAAEQAEQDRQAAETGWTSSVGRTKRQLAAAPRFRLCPTCGVMVEHDGGCNMMYHDTCRTRWCFVCQRVGTCSDFNCKAPESQLHSESLGSADVPVHEASPSPPVPPALSSRAATAAAVHVDHSKPLFKTRVCFNDGSQKEFCFNDDHTVGDLRCLSSMSSGHPLLELKVRLPGASPLTDDSILLKTAGLLNAVVIACPQRM